MNFRLGMGKSHLQILPSTVDRSELDRGGGVLLGNGERPSAKHPISERKPMGHRQNPTNSSGNRLPKVMDWSIGFWT